MLTRSYLLFRNRKIKPTPMTPRPTTDKPITAPPLKAIFSALFMPRSRAALAVRTLAFVATVIPKNPARVENRAPSTKQTAVSQLITKPITKNSTAAKTIRIRYSANKKARAPVAMASAISFIFAVPASFLPM